MIIGIATLALATTLVPSGTYVYSLNEAHSITGTSTVVVSRDGTSVVAEESADLAVVQDTMITRLDPTTFSVKSFTNRDGQPLVTASDRGATVYQLVGGSKAVPPAIAGAPASTFNYLASSFIFLPAMLHASGATAYNEYSMNLATREPQGIAVTVVATTVARPAQVPEGDASVSLQRAGTGEVLTLWYDPATFVLDAGELGTRIVIERKQFGATNAAPGVAIPSGIYIYSFRNGQLKGSSTIEVSRGPEAIIVKETDNLGFVVVEMIRKLDPKTFSLLSLTDGNGLKALTLTGTGATISNWGGPAKVLSPVLPGAPAIAADGSVAQWLCVPAMLYASNATAFNAFGLDLASRHPFARRVRIVLTTPARPSNVPASDVAVSFESTGDPTIVTLWYDPQTFIVDAARGGSQVHFDRKY